MTHNGTHGRIYTDAGDLLLQPAGGVAINTSSAGAYKLNVNGDAYVSGTIKTATKTGSIIIPPAAFEAEYYDYQFRNWGHSIVPLENLIGFTTPLNLPHGVTVTSVTSYWQDNSISDGQIYIYRMELASGNYTTMAYSATSWQNTVRTGMTNNTISSAQIDNQNFMYYIEIILYTNIYFFGVKIEYTYDEIK